MLTRMIRMVSATHTNHSRKAHEQTSQDGRKLFCLVPRKLFDGTPPSSSLLSSINNALSIVAQGVLLLAHASPQPSLEDVSAAILIGAKSAGSPVLRDLNILYSTNARMHSTVTGRKPVKKNSHRRKWRSGDTTTTNALGAKTEAFIDDLKFAVTKI